MNDILTQLIQSIAKHSVKVVDLTQTLDEATPVIQLPPQFAPCKAFKLEEISKYDDRGPAWYWNNFECSEHTGTHFDAPIHWVTGKDLPENATDTISPTRFIAPACVMDITDKANEDPDFLFTKEDILAWEKEHQRIPAGSWLLLRTGWSRRKDPDEYLNMDENGAHTPGPHPEVVPFLIEERDVIGYGTETVGTDAGQGFRFEPAFPCHSKMHGANRFGLPGLTNLDQLPPVGAIVIAAPLKIRSGSGSPCRVFALVPA